MGVHQVERRLAPSEWKVSATIWKSKSAQILAPMMTRMSILEEDEATSLVYTRVLAFSAVDGAVTKHFLKNSPLHAFNFVHHSHARPER